MHVPVRERSPEVKAHRQVVQTDVEDIVKFLEEVLTRRLVAYMVGTSDVKAVGRWASGDRRPRRETEERLRAIFHVFQLLQQAESPHTVRAWFIGLNPQLDD